MVLLVAISGNEVETPDTVLFPFQWNSVVIRGFIVGKVIGRPPALYKHRQVGTSLLHDLNTL